MRTVALIPGLVSDARVWRTLRKALEGRAILHDGNITVFPDIAQMAMGLLFETEGELIVVGHSLGGRVAMEMARQSPDRVKALVLANTGHTPKKPGEEVKRHEMIALGHRSMDALAAQWLPPMLDPARVGDAALVGDLTEMVLNAGAEVHERQICSLLNRPDAGTYMPSCKAPVLLITGAQDGWSPEAQHREIQQMVPDGELKVIDNAGHFMPVEQPAATADAIVEWLERRDLL